MLSGTPIGVRVGIPACKLIEAQGTAVSEAGNRRRRCMEGRATHSQLPSSAGDLVPALEHVEARMDQDAGQSILDEGGGRATAPSMREGGGHTSSYVDAVTRTTSEPFSNVLDLTHQPALCIAKCSS